MNNTDNIKELLINEFKNGNIKETKLGVKTVELQNVQFVADKDHILRKPNYDYAKREIEWYKSQSLNVYDIKGNVPEIWKQCADVNGDINSNYGWMIYSKENGSQFNNCLWQLVNDPATREAVMIYNRPSMHIDAISNHKKDFCCTFSVQCFLNPYKDGYRLKYIVYQRSQDAVFGFNNDILWHMHVYNELLEELNNKLTSPVYKDNIICNVGSLHVYERHFKLLS
jgi:thymidylate synthase